MNNHHNNNNGSSNIDIKSKERLEKYVKENFVYIDYKVSSSNLIEDSNYVTLKLFPTWDQKTLEYVQCKDGITNKLVKCYNKSLNISLLIRAYGNKSEVLIDRNQEILNLVRLSMLELSPPLYGRFSNGFVYGYIPGKVFTVEDMSDPYKSTLVAKKLAQWHSVDMVGDKTANLFPTLYKWLGEVPISYSNSDINKKFHENFNIKKIKLELLDLEKELIKLNSPIVFCHNDLLSANIIYDEALKEVSFIDYEYGNYSYRGFDIGNHFNEFAGFECNYSMYPSKEFQCQWLKTYLTDSYPDKEITDEMIENLYKEVNKFALASHFYWGLWALIQAHYSDINFDYMEYSMLRFNEYYKCKEEFFAL
ncbi:17755_t:CDS:2 [Entrophospora sp. SA101]|nr:11851_t:CDS:2 [Entrophospora sp. SA101]CAJ0747427.1 17755_t:CDS:2 [Entrophospora sp. SA101]CAJ0829681.1 15570_t:CDS:2 [Entrophospora sp. SA101]CAJ0833175.1 7695_t:CDS:2 [Entrophospora sp. SA101]